MTKTYGCRIGADVTERTRAFLLRSFPPAFENVQCKALTHAYKVSESFQYPTGKLRVIVYGHHKSDTHEAFLVSVNGQTFRPDGFRYFIAHSIAPGVDPFQASEIDSENIVNLERPLLIDNMRFASFPLWNHNAVRKAAYA